MLCQIFERLHYKGVDRKCTIWLNWILSWLMRFLQCDWWGFCSVLRLYTVFITRTLKFMYCVDEKCPDGWTHFGVKCYKYFPEPFNWITAEVMWRKTARHFYYLVSYLKRNFLQINDKENNQPDLCFKWIHKLIMNWKCKIWLFRDSVKLMMQILHRWMINWKMIICWAWCLLTHVFGVALRMVNK